MALINEIYGAGVHKLKSEEREFKINQTSSNTTEINVISSNYHLDVTPAEAEHYDRVVIQKLIKEVASTHQLDTTTQKNFKIIIINECDRLTKEAQAALRRTMEKYIAKCRLILCCENIGRVSQPLKSRCLLIRVPAPNSDDMKLCLQKVTSGEKLGNLPEKFVENLIKSNEGNLRSTILSLQTAKMQQSMSDNAGIQKAEWKTAVSVIAKDILQQQTPDQLKSIREKFYDLLVNCIPGEMIIKELLYQLQKLTEAEIQFEFIHYAAHHENRMQLGKKAIFHLEAFAAQAMVIYRKHKMNM